VTVIDAAADFDDVVIVVIALTWESTKINEC